MTVTVTRAEAERFRDLVARHLGLHFDDAKLGDLADVLRARVRNGSVATYLGAPFDESEVGAIAERLTVGETYFFRYREQFDALVDVVLPELGRARERRIRILSVGCAGGDEPYSLAIAARECGVAARVEIRAFDVNPAAILRARAGRYSAWSLRETPAEIRDRYFVERDNLFELAASVRADVAFERRNILDDGEVWRPESADLVFCRNVIMYFDTETMRRVVGRVARALRGNGFLFLGHAETLRGLSTDFHLRHTHGTFYYERKDGAASSPIVHEVRAPSAALPAADADASWIQIIQGASERVTKLASDLRAVPPTRPPNPSEEDVDSKMLRAVVLTNTGKLDEADRVCRELLADDDLNAGAHYLLALCRDHAGERAAALEHDRMATYLEPGFVMPRIHSALLERRAGNFARALTALSAALDILPAEDAARIILFGGGFSRESLALLCRSEMRRCAEHT